MKPHHPILMLLLASALGLLHPAPAESRDLFVSTTGDDSTGESWETSFNLIGRALDYAEEGDAVHVAAGVYIESVTIPLGLSLLGGHPPQSSGNKVYNRNPRIHTTTIGSTEEFTAIRMRHYSVLDGFDVFGRVFQSNEVNPPRLGDEYSSVTLRLCRIYYEDPGIAYPAIDIESNINASNDLFVEDCFVRYSTEQPREFMHLYSFSRFTNTIFSYDLPLETFPIVLRGFSPRFVNCVFYDRGGFTRPNTLAPTVGGIILDVYNSISNQHISVTSGGPFANRVGFSILPFPPSAFSSSFSADPQFIDPHNDDFRVHPTSPAIDRGADRVGWTPLHDFMGRPRVVNIPGVGGTGIYAVDIGAYEMQLDEYRLRSDLNGDGVVDALDLLIFSQDWHEGTGP